MWHSFGSPWAGLWRRGLGACLVLLAMAGSAIAHAVEFSEIRDFREVFRISGQALGPDLVEIRWDIEPDYYLYNNKFLEFTTTTPGVTLDTAIIPVGKPAFDPLLGQDVIKFYQQLVVSIPLASVEPGVRDIDLRIRSQGCRENVLCYPPTWQELTVSLPQVATADSGLSASLGLGEEEQQAGFGQAEGLLEVDQAFVFETIMIDAGTLLARFTPQAGYYLYRDKFSFSVDAGEGVAVAAADLPPGTIKQDPEFGPVPVYFQTTEIPIRLQRSAGPARQITLLAGYQGCKDGEICYPPQTRAIVLDLPAAATDMPVSPGAGAKPATTSTAPPVSEQDRLARLLVDNPPGALLAFFVAGLLLAFTPCVFPMVPILSGIIAGQGKHLTSGRAFSLSLVYVLAMSVTYTVAGVLAGLFGQNLQAVFQNPWIIVGFVAIFVLLALSMFGLFELQLPSRWQTALTEQSNRQAGGRFTGVAVMGFLSALIVGPCVAPPLAAALIVIGASGSAVLGGAALFSLSLGMGVPLILFGMSAGKLIPRAGAWMGTIKTVFGVGLLALGIWMLERILPGNVIMLLWGALAIGCGIRMGALERLPQPASGWRSLWKAVGLVLLLLGALEIVGAASGGDRWTRPLQHLAGNTQQHGPAFQRIKSLEDVSAALSASTGQRPAMLDFYADWCVECIRMERTTFVEPGVAGLMGQMLLLQADVTPNDEVDQALMRRYGIIGPPAILFFDRKGEEMREYRLVGYFTADEFSTHLQRVLDGS